jgi:hypothetical protein
VSEAIAVAGTLAGASIGVCGALLVSRRERHHALRTRMRDAYGVYLGAVYPAVSTLRELPDVNGLPNSAKVINQLRGERATYVTTRERERQIFGDSLRLEQRAVAIAVADLQVLPLPLQARAAVDRSLDYLERLAERRTPEIKAEWSEVHADLAAAAALLRSQ